MASKHPRDDDTASSDSTSSSELTTEPSVSLPSEADVTDLAMNEQGGFRAQSFGDQSSHSEVDGGTGESAIARKISKRVKIKREKDLERSKSSADYSSDSSAANDDDGTGTPRDRREMSMVEYMKNMGFADVREILGGLRHVESESASTGRDLSGMEEHLELAMMWIVNQREEAEEARKMDETRIFSEVVQQCQWERPVAEKLHGAPLEEIVGSKDDTKDSKEKRGRRSFKSKFFPRSELLRSPLVRGVFLSISSDADKSELLRFLTLERNAYSWYGAVLPWCYFHYVSRNRFESFAEGGGDHGGSLGDLLRQQADELQRALFSLSEQQDNGLRTNVPRVFLHAQRDARSKGLPDSPGVSNGCADVHGDDEVVIVKTCAVGEN